MLAVLNREIGSCLEEIDGRADLAMLRHAVNRFQFDLPFVHEPSAGDVPKVV
jgi:hypothetical protein